MAMNTTGDVDPTGLFTLIPAENPFSWYMSSVCHMEKKLSEGIIFRSPCLGILTPDLIAFAKRRAMGETESSPVKSLEFNPIP